MNMSIPDQKAERGLPLVSIITPCLNSVRFIEQCIKSVLAQSYPRVEHIVQDGASVDGTVGVLRRYTELVDWVSEPDRGQADALDKALKRSRGDILLVLNADDLLLPHAAAWAVTALARCPREAVIYGDVYLIDERGYIIGEFLAPEYDFPSVLCVEKVLPAQAAFIRRSALEQVGLGADATLDTCPDYEMFVRLGLQFPMRHVPGFVTEYRVYPRPMDGAGPRRIDRFIQAKTRVMERVFDNCADPKEIKALRRRARAGLLLWASDEARRMADSRSAFEYFKEAMSLFGIVGRALAATVRFYVTSQDEQTREKKMYRPSPSLSRALAAGRALLQGSSRPRRVARFTRAVAPAFQVLASVALSVLISYLIILWRIGR